MSKSNQNQSLPKDVAWECASAAFDNAIKHHQWAVRMAEERDWGIATAHLVLSLEEASKSAILSLYSLEFLSLLQESIDLMASKLSAVGWEPCDLTELVNSSFSKHKAKHYIAFHLIFYFWMSTQYKQTVKRKLDFAFLGCILWDLFKNPQKYREFLMTIKWLANADELKKRGFYVDVANKAPLSPETAKEKDYRAGLTVVSSLIMKFEHIKKVWIENEMKRDALLKEIGKHRSEISVEIGRELKKILSEKELTKMLRKTEEHFDPTIFVSSI